MGKEEKGHSEECKLSRKREPDLEGAEWSKPQSTILNCRERLAEYIKS